MTGSTKETVDADQAKLIITLLRTISQGSLSSGNISIARDRGIVYTLLKKYEVADSAINSGPVSMNQMDKRGQVPFILKKE